MAGRPDEVAFQVGMLAGEDAKVIVEYQTSSYKDNPDAWLVAGSVTCVASTVPNWTNFFVAPATNADATKLLRYGRWRVRNTSASKDALVTLTGVARRSSF